MVVKYNRPGYDLVTFMKNKKTKLPKGAEEVARTIRMPRNLWDAVSERSVTETAKGRGRWSANAIVVDAIRQAESGWGKESAG